MQHNKYWTDIVFHHSGDAFYSALIERIRKAQRSITIESYIFAYDQLTEIIFKELELAIGRGCEVRILIDGFGSYFWLARVQDECRRLKIQFRVFHPLPRLFNIVNSMRWLVILSMIEILRRLNRRNHRKITIIDQKYVFLGSLNFTQVHLESIMGDTAWRDSGVELTGPEVEILVHAFNEAWLRAKYFRWKRKLWKKIKKGITDPIRSIVRLNTSPRMRWKLYRDLLRRIRSSQNRILITTAYFIPRPRMTRALIRAAQRGVRVEVILPGVSDVPIVKWASYHIIHVLREAGVIIHEYQNRILHAKYMIIDEWSSLGSMNFNHRSFLHDLEVEAVFTDPDSLNNLSDQWNLDRSNSTIVIEEKYLGTSLIKRLLSRIFFLLRYWL